MKTLEITASTQRLANGWAPVLEFPNGGRQLFSSRHGTMDSALLEAKWSLLARLNYPECACPDPEANTLQILADLRK